MSPAEVFRMQRGLRERLLDDRSTLPWQPARDLAAQLLLYLDDPAQCWRLIVGWVRDVSDADRVYGGFAQPNHATYSPQAEACRPSQRMPSVVGVAMNAQDEIVRDVWAAKGIVVFDDVAKKGRFSRQMQDPLQEMGTRSKLSIALWDAQRPVGLLCADWLRAKPSWPTMEAENLSTLARVMLGPVLSAAQRIATETRSRVDTVPADTPCETLAGLTPAELKIAGMVARGVTYKEIARELDRSFSTVDHQLRSVRDKLGVSSTARLVRVLAELLPAGSGTSAEPRAPLA